MHIAPFEQSRAGIECFLVETRAGAFLVNQRMRCLLEALVEHSSMTGLRAQLERSLGTSVDEAEISAAIAGLPKAVFRETPDAAGKTPFHFSCRLLPARAVRAIAHPFRQMYSPVIVAAVAVLLLAELPWLVHGLRSCTKVPLEAGSVLLILFGASVIALLHELGHAAACAWYGLAPGEIGFGLYLIFPAFYTDVNQAWKLTPARRAVVDAGGMYFQIILIALAVPLAHGLDDDPRIFAFILFNLYLIFHNLNPLFKMDGYWIFSDLAGLPNLHKRTWQVFRQAFRRGRQPPNPSPSWIEGKRTLLLLHAYALAVLAYAAFVVATLPRWFVTQLQPYPALAGAQFHAARSAWSAADYRSVGEACGQLALDSLMPALVFALLVSWIGRVSRRLLAKRDVA